MESKRNKIDTSNPEENIKKNSINLGLLIVAILSLIVMSYFGIQNYTLNKEISELEEPIILAPGLRVNGNSFSVDFPFYVKNPSDKEYYIDITQGSCLPDSSLITKSIPKQNKDSQENVNVGEDITISKIQPQTVFPVPPHDQITLQCSGFDVQNPIKDELAHMRVCIKEKRISDPICEDIQITIIKR